MLQQFSSYIANVENLDPAIDIRKKVLNTILLITSILTIFPFIVSLLVPPDIRNSAFLIAAPVFLFFSFAVYLLNRYFSVLLSSIVFVAVLTAIMFLIDTPVELLEGRSLFFFSIPIVMASILIRPNASFFTAMAISLIMYIITIRYDLFFNIFALAGFLTLSFLSWLSASRLENSLRELDTINKELDLRVAQRTNELASAITQLENANIKLLDLDKLKSKFVTDVSHELRTPLSNLTIYLDMLENSSTPSNDRNSHYFSVLKDETKRITRLVTDILDLSKLESDQKLRKTEIIDVNEVIEIITTPYLYDVKNSKVDVLLDLDPYLSSIIGDKDQITIILRNIISNAVNYTSVGEVRISSYNLSFEKIAIKVVDTGTGIPETDKKHIFDRFYRGELSSQSTIPGTGLGLSIAKELIDLHEGEIVLESEVGKGSSFTVLFPTKIEIGNNGL